MVQTPGRCFDVLSTPLKILRICVLPWPHPSQNNAMKVGLEMDDHIGSSTAFAGAHQNSLLLNIDALLSLRRVHQVVLSPCNRHQGFCEKNIPKDIITTRFVHCDCLSRHHPPSQTPLRRHSLLQCRSPDRYHRMYLVATKPMSHQDHKQYQYPVANPNDVPAYLWYSHFS